MTLIKYLLCVVLKKYCLILQTMTRGFVFSFTTVLHLQHWSVILFLLLFTLQCLSYKEGTVDSEKVVLIRLLKRSKVEN